MKPQTGPTSYRANPDWRQLAACLGNPWPFHAADGHQETAIEKRQREAKALAICLQCPVMLDCRRAYIGEKHGIFGGLTAEERALLRRKRVAA